MTYSIYRNLHNGKLSIKSKASGLVVGYCDYIEMQNVSFKVNKKGVQRIRDKQRKEVVAVVQGGIRYIEGFIPRDSRRVQEVIPNLVNAPRVAVTFNPYKSLSFFERVTGAAVHSAAVCSIEARGAIYID